jgi:flavodoxin
VKPRGAIRVGAALVIAGALLGCGSRPDSVSGASMRLSAVAREGCGVLPGQPVIVTPSDRGGAARLASAMAARLGACVVSPASVTTEELTRASLLGLGSGIFDQAHHKALLDLAEALPPIPGRRAFIFSTSGVSRERAPGLNEDDPHAALRERLIARGCEIVGEFNCEGYNDNSFLFLVGGINKGRPNAKDLARAEAFADSLVPPVTRQ